MSGLLGRGPSDGGRGWGRTAISVLAVAALGVLVGYQYLQPDKRVLAVSAALVLFGVAWRIDLVSGIGVLLLALPFPRETVFGSTNLAFILLLLVIWLLRFTQRTAPGPRHTPFDAPLAAVVLAGVLSFYNLDTVDHLGRALMNFNLFIACILMFYLIVNNVRREDDLRRLVTFQVASIGVVYLFCLWELAFPAHQLIPGWIDLRNINAESVVEKTYRIGGPWYDYEQLSEYVAINIPLFIFLIAQARSMTRRVVFSIFLFASILIIFATVTRGGVASLAVGLAYLLYLVRRRVQIVPFTIIGGLAAALLAAVSAYLSRFTVAGDLTARFQQTHFVGWIPDSRAEVWPQAWGRMLEHPLIGHGPVYTSERGLKVWFWPHDLYLYVGNCYGFLGLSLFVWFLWKLWKSSTPRTDRLDDPDYSKAFLLMAHVQLLIFVVDEIKIEYLRNPVYMFQPWVFFSTLAAASLVASRARVESPARAVRPSARAPLPARV